MCGICGLVARDGADPALVERMNGAIAHRGPDAGRVVALGRCALGYRRLSVVDLVTGDQPATNEDGTITAVFNGEIYGFGALRDRLARAGHVVPGTGDTPVIPHLLEEHGLSFPVELDGMFAIAAWDAARGRLVLVRDRIGKKPLLYAQLPGGGLAFASELKALLQLPGLRRDIDREAIDGYLALQYVPGTATGVQGIAKVPPGSVLTWEDGKVEIARYWSLEPTGESHTDDEWLERIRAEVRAAVRRRLVADVPLGALLSGGVDSAIVVGLMAEASSAPVRTFTVGFPDRRYDERERARLAAGAFGTHHEEIDVDVDPVTLAADLAWTVDEPLGDEAVLPTLLVSRAARRHVTVALVGDGGDEAFAGYERYSAMRLAATAGRVPALPRAGARALRALPGGSTVPRSTAFRLARLLDVAALPPAQRYGALMEVFPQQARQALYTAEMPAPRAAWQILGAPPGRGVHGLQRLDASTYLPGDLLPKSDLASMSASLEMRSPLLDHRVLELGVSLPPHLLVAGRRGKVGLRRAFADLLPPGLLAQGKTGFGVPIGGWFRGPLRDMAGDLLLGRGAHGRGLFVPTAVERMLAEHVRGDRDHAHRLWCLLVLELWQRTWLDPVVAPATRDHATAAVRLGRAA